MDLLNVLNPVAADYVLTRALATHKAPAQIISELVKKNSRYRSLHTRGGGIAFPARGACPALPARVYLKQEKAVCMQPTI
jgi:hypothetical protein